MQERRELLRLLLQTLDDHLPRPRSTYGGGESGPSSSRYVKDAGTGEWRPRRAGEKAWDAYLEEPLEDALKPGWTISGARDTRAEIARLTASIDRIQRILDAKEGRIDHERFGWEIEREALDRTGSYQKLRKLLAELKLAHPDQWQAVMRRYDPGREGMPFAPGIEEQRLADLGEAWIEERIGSIRLPPWILEWQADRRRNTIAGLAAQGYGAGAIAKRLRIPKKAVQRQLRAIRATTSEA